MTPHCTPGPAVLPHHPPADAAAPALCAARGCPCPFGPLLAGLRPRARNENLWVVGSPVCGVWPAGLPGSQHGFPPARRCRPRLRWHFPAAQRPGAPARVPTDPVSAAGGGVLTSLARSPSGRWELGRGTLTPRLWLVHTSVRRFAFHPAERALDTQDVSILMELDFPIFSCPKIPAAKPFPVLPQIHLRLLDAGQTEDKAVGPHPTSSQTHPGRPCSSVGDQRVALWPMGYGQRRVRHSQPWSLKSIQGDPPLSFLLPSRPWQPHV